MQTGASVWFWSDVLDHSDTPPLFAVPLFEAQCFCDLGVIGEPELFRERGSHVGQVRFFCNNQHLYV